MGAKAYRQAFQTFNKAGTLQLCQLVENLPGRQADNVRVDSCQAGWQVVELADNREMSLCCGAGGGVKSNYPDLANAIAQARLAQVENGRLCTACPLCYAHFKENAGDIQVMEFSEALISNRKERR